MRLNRQALREMILKEMAHLGIMSNSIADQILQLFDEGISPWDNPNLKDMLENLAISGTLQELGQVVNIIANSGSPLSADYLSVIYDEIDNRESQDEYSDEFGIYDDPYSRADATIDSEMDFSDDGDELESIKQILSDTLGY